MNFFEVFRTVLQNRRPHWGPFYKVLRATIRGYREQEPKQQPWTVDRDGRVRTDKDRPVVLRGRK